jgi:hypothetical protein
MSCDLLPTDVAGPHYQGDVRDVLDYPWDLMIAHPPCTDLAVSGARHFTAKRLDGRQQIGASFVLMLSKSDIPRIAIENPIGILSSLWRKPEQIVQPYEYGHSESKSTCLWLKNLPTLKPTNILTMPAKGYWDNQTPSGQNKLGPSEDRWKIRSATYTGIADAMAEQWGIL